MATMRKRNNKYVVIYDYYDNNGKRRQKWETFINEDDAKRFKLEVELSKMKNTFVIPIPKTVGDYLEEYVRVYAKGKWKHRTYETNTSVIRNHIIPHIGKLEIQEVSPRDIEFLLNDTLRSKKISGFQAQNVSEDELSCLSSTTIRYVYTILKKAFAKAVEWKYIVSNPVICEAPKAKNAERNIWDEETFFNVLDELDDNDILHLAVHTTYVGSLRVSETVGITWDCVDFDRRTIHISKGLQRITKESLKLLPKDDLIYVFPEVSASSKSVLALMKPKTDKSVRYIYMTDTLIEELQKRKDKVQRDKAYHVENYNDYNLVFCFDDGSPIEPKRCSRWFKKWQKERDLPFQELDFHEIRHTSATHQLVHSGGNIKAVQRNTGHATAGVLVDIYAHTQEKDRKELVQKMGGRFGYKSQDEEQAKHRTLQNPVLADKAINVLLKLMEGGGDDMQRMIINALNAL